MGKKKINKNDKIQLFACTVLNHTFKSSALTTIITKLKVNFGKFSGESFADNECQMWNGPAQTRFFQSDGSTGLHCRLFNFI